MDVPIKKCQEEIGRLRRRIKSFNESRDHYLSQIEQVNENIEFEESQLDQFIAAEKMLMKEAGLEL